MKWSLWVFSLVVLGTGCTKNIDEYNVDTKKPSQVLAETLLPTASVALADGLASASVNTNVFRFTIKHWAMTTYQDEAQYDFFTRGIPDAWWARMYRDVLTDLKSAKQILADADPAQLPEAVRANQTAIIDIMEVYAYSVLVNTFGDVPYSQSNDADNVLFPPYENAASIYDDLLARLAADIESIDPSGDGFEAGQDLLGGGDMDKWLTFAHSLHAKLGMMLADVDAAKAKAAVEASMANAISSPEDNVSLTYLDAPPNSNPLYDDIILGGRGDYIASEELMAVLNNSSDPRKPFFFDPNNAGQYVGGVVGRVNNPLSAYSQPDQEDVSLVTSPTAPVLFLDYVEMEFFRAEAIERGFNVAGTAAEHYANAIRASIRYWGGTEAEATAYLARPDVAYATAAGDWKQKIGAQKWIALYNRPYDGWTELRRLDYPQLTPAFGALSDFPNRFTYPAVEQQVNGGSYAAAAAAIGGDAVETKLFWDIY